MKSYLTSAAITIFGFYAASSMDIPVDNQLAMLAISCLGLAMFLLTAASDLKSSIERKAIERYENESK
jgi:predicted RND superfamily exporter protein